MAGSGTARRVVIVDDSRTIQAMLDTAFSNRADFRVVGLSSDASSAAEMIRRLMPDIVTIDVCMPYLDGLALLEMIGDLKSVCKIMVSDTAVTNILMTSKLIEAGASACLGKSDLVRDPVTFFKRVNSAADALAKDKRHAPGQTRSSGSGSVSGPSGSIPGDAAARDPIAAFPVPADEKNRLQLLRRKDLANAVRERSFDLITRHVAKISAFPVSLLTFIDRDTQWIKSGHGLDIESTPRHQAFCNYTISQMGAFVVSDAAADDRFAHNPLVTGDPHIRCYAGYPVTASGGVNVAALCVIDTRARTVSKHVLEQLADMAGVIAEFLDKRLPIAA